MIVNNFNEIKELLIKEDPYDFWFGQIIKRKKDNPLMDRSERIIKSYNFSNHDKLLDRMDEIMSICEYNNARFYLNPNIRNIKLCNIRLIQSLMQSIAYHLLTFLLIYLPNQLYPQSFPLVSLLGLSLRLVSLWICID